MSFTWNVYADIITSMPDLNHYCPVKMPTDYDVEVRAIRSFFVFYNLPDLSNLTLNIYSDLNGAPGQLLFTSTSSQATSEVLSPSANSAVAEIWFEFAQLPKLKKANWYHIVLNGTYVYSASSHLAWKKAWPDPQNSNGLDATDARILWEFPYDLAIVGSKS